MGIGKQIEGLNPRFVGQVFRLRLTTDVTQPYCLNPRFVGQVFRLNKQKVAGRILPVLIPDSWGKSSDKYSTNSLIGEQVLIPDSWGKSSDLL